MPLNVRARVTPAPPSSVWASLGFRWGSAGRQTAQLGTAARAYLSLHGQVPVGSAAVRARPWSHHGGAQRCQRGPGGWATRYAAGGIARRPAGHLPRTIRPVDQPPNQPHKGLLAGGERRGSVPSHTAEPVGAASKAAWMLPHGAAQAPQPEPSPPLPSSLLLLPAATPPPLLPLPPLLPSMGRGAANVAAAASTAAAGALQSPGALLPDASSACRRTLRMLAGGRGGRGASRISGKTSVATRC